MYDTTNTQRDTIIAVFLVGVSLSPSVSPSLSALLSCLTSALCVHMVDPSALAFLPTIIDVHADTARGPSRPQANTEAARTQLARRHMMAIVTELIANGHDMTFCAPRVARQQWGGDSS